MKFKVELKKMFTAGMYDLIREDYGEEVRLRLSGGQPYSSAYKEAKDLAALLDCDLIIDGEVVLKSSESQGGGEC